MSKQVEWSKIVLEEFIRVGNLTDFEERIMRTRVAGWTRIEQAMKFDVSISTVDRTIARLKHKYDVSQRFSPILPKRKRSIQELYQDMF